MSQPVKDNYIFSRSEADAIRLNYIHWLSIRLCGFLVHPSIPKESPNLRVADVGAGSGIWAMELAHELPRTARIDAFDNSDSQFPATAWVPPNLHFWTHDCFKPFAEDLLGKFDVVNVRFFVTIITPQTLPPLIQNLTTLLKPGGYLQWYEPDMGTTTVTTGSLSFNTPAVDKLVSIMKKPIPNADHSFAATLDQSFVHQGLELVTFDRYPMRDTLRPFFCHTQIMTYEALCEKLEQQGMLEPVKAAREHLQEVKDEFQKGAAVAQEFVCCIGRKGTA